MTITQINRDLQNEYECQIITMLIGGSDDARKEHILKHLCADMFTNRNLRDIFKAADDIYQSGNEINIANVCEVIAAEAKQQLSIELDKNFITNVNCDFYLTKLLDAYIKRLIQSASEFDELKKIEAVKNRYSLNSSINHISYGAEKLIPDYYDKWETSVKTYYSSIDNKLGTLQGGDFMVLAGAPGMGKTCMMLNFIMNMAKNGVKIDLFSLEMSLPQLQNRVISAATGIDADKIRKFNMTETEIKKYNDFATSEFFKNLNIRVSSRYNITIDNIRDIVLKSDANIIFIDYLGLINGDGSRGAYEKVSEISRRLKLLALETNKPVIALHQLNRTIAERKDKRPQISDLRDSGKIEQDADFICFVYRPAYYGESALNKQELEFLIAKSRHTNGRNVIRLVYDGAKQKISDIVKSEVRQCSIAY